jgi:ubiquinone/menaquinone biosynthesis C-methylase UbiE
MDDSKMKAALAGIYDVLAPAYERAVVPVFRPIAKRMLQFIDLRPGWQVLDAGTGTGLVALLGAPRVGKSGKMIGVDASEKMLELARRKAGQFGLSQCEFRVGDLESLDLPDAQFHAVLSQFALHHTDPAKSLREFHRVLMPGGILVVQEWAETPHTPNQVIFDVLAKYRVAEASGVLAFVRAQSEHAYDLGKVAQPETMTGLFRAAGFSDVQARIEPHSLRVANAEAVVELAMAAPLLHAEIAALSAGAGAVFLDEAREAVRVFETANGCEWTYNVLALVARG